MPGRTWYLHGSIDSFPFIRYRGAPDDHAEAQRAGEGMHKARRAFRAATLAGDFGAAITAELAWCAREAELREVMERLRHPKLQPFTAEDIHGAVKGIRRYADAMFDQPELWEEEEDCRDEEEDDGGEDD